MLTLNINGIPATVTDGEAFADLCPEGYADLLGQARAIDATYSEKELHGMLFLRFGSHHDAADGSWFAWNPGHGSLLAAPIAPTCMSWWDGKAWIDIKDPRRASMNIIRQAFTTYMLAAGRPWTRTRDRRPGHSDFVRFDA